MQCSNPDLPDTGMVCCDGAVYGGPERCTCWVNVYDTDQEPPTRDPIAPGTRPSMCADCAYRPGSPERTGVEHVTGTAQALDDLVTTGHPFFCHQGLRRIVGLRHPPSGMTIGYRHTASDYSGAPIGPDHVPYQADGRPADYCAGWAARRAHAEKTTPRAEHPVFVCGYEPHPFTPPNPAAPDLGECLVCSLRADEPEHATAGPETTNAPVEVATVLTTVQLESPALPFPPIPDTGDKTL